MSEKLTRETIIPVDTLTSFAIFGGGPFSTNPLPNCMAMNELGIIFLNTKDCEERQSIEKTFVGVLQNPDAGENRKFAALAFLKRPDAIVSDDTKTVVEEFENNPSNTHLVNDVKERLARD